MLLFGVVGLVGGVGLGGECGGGEGGRSIEDCGGRG